VPFSSGVDKACRLVRLSRSRGQYRSRRGSDAVLRHRLRELAARQALDPPPAVAGDPEAEAARARTGRRIQAALLALPERLRLPLVLFDVEGLPYSEISSVVGIPEGTVKSRIHRARAALREELRDLVRAPEGT
jgi:RNA polymerase sigma-70 factor (ECF subfamily)